MNETIYQFLCNYLTDLNIPFHIVCDHSVTLEDLDFGLRKSILKENQIPTVSSLEDYHPSALYHFSDFYMCNYTFFNYRMNLSFLSDHIY